MGSRFTSNFVYILDEENNPHFVQRYYGANLGDSYRSDIYLNTKSYCVLDLYMTDEVEVEGEFLPHVKEKEWRSFFTEGPSSNIATILAEAGLADISISKLVFFYIESSSHMILEFDGFVSSAEGLQPFDEDFLNQALAATSAGTNSIAERESLIAQWIIEQVRNGNTSG